MARYSCPQIRPEEYKWKQSNTDPALWQRRACGVEAVIAIEASKQQGHSGLFFSAKVQLWSDSHNLSNVTEAARCAWLKLRLKHPEIACFPGYDRQQKGLIQYRAPQDHQEANQWAEKTIIVKASHGTPLAIPDSLTTTRKDAVSGFYAVTVHITASVESESVPLGETELHFLFHANHLFFDGIGLRQLIGIFFNILAQTLSSDLPRGLKPLAWQNSAQNLSSAVIELMDPAQNVSGLAFEKSLRLMMGYVLRNSVPSTL